MHGYLYSVLQHKPKELHPYMDLFASTYRAAFYWVIVILQSDNKVLFPFSFQMEQLAKY